MLQGAQLGRIHKNLTVANRYQFTLQKNLIFSVMCHINVNLDVTEIASLFSLWFHFIIVQQLGAQESISKVIIINIKVILWQKKISTGQGSGGRAMRRLRIAWVLELDCLCTNFDSTYYLPAAWFIIEYQFAHLENGDNKGSQHRGMRSQWVKTVKCLAQNKNSSCSYYCCLSIFSFIGNHNLFKSMKHTCRKGKTLRTCHVTNRNR